MSLTAERVRELLAYDPETGVWTRRITMGHARVGDVASSLHKDDGYRRIIIDRRSYKASRLAFLYMTGKWPTDQIDHRNLDKGDDRWCNLREATRCQNGHNCLARKNNRLGIKGVYLRKRPGRTVEFVVLIEANGKRRQVRCRRGTTLGEAADLYASLAREMHAEFARAG